MQTACLKTLHAITNKNNFAFYAIFQLCLDELDIELKLCELKFYLFKSSLHIMMSKFVFTCKGKASKSPYSANSSYEIIFFKDNIPFIHCSNELASQN